jgi:hypothetical protein
MAVKKKIGQTDVRRFLDSVFEEDVHAKRVLSLANATLGVMASGSLAIHAIGQGLAHVSGLMSKHAIKQVDRLLSNQGIDVWAYFAYWVPYLVGSREHVVVAMDWTDFDGDGHATIALNLLTRHGRATPLIWKTVAKSSLKNHRNDFEDDVLNCLKETLPEGVKVTIVADRGFCDTKLLALLQDTLGFDYVIRLRSNVFVTSSTGESRKAAQWVGAGGRAKTLRNASITARDFAVPTVVCTQAKGMKEPWCLVASDPKAKAAELVRHYAKRWGIESSFRDTKAARFGLGMDATHIRSPERRDRLFLLSAFAIALLTLLGGAGEELGYDRMLKANTVKKRTHSLFRQGLILYESIPNMPVERLRPLIQRFSEILLNHRTFNEAFGII